ncbi:MAG: T9SS type A sorting domain-containing protein [Bacteroidetes bacterium]|nr:T9SS type A sorting domain-containing protein [Bacteroidota bacterium]
MGKTYVSPAGDSFSITHNPTIYDSMWVKMGSTQDTTFKDTMRFGHPYWLMKRGLTQVFFQPKVTIYGADTTGTWVRFPIDRFSYNPGMNLVVELDRGYQGFNNGFDWMISRGCAGCSLGTWYDTSWCAAEPSTNQADIGFDDAPTTVGGLVNLKGFYAFPNPSEGLFTVGFEPWGSHVSKVQVSVSDMAGRQVWQRSYQNVQASLFTVNVDLRGRPKGIYLLRVQADAAQALKRVVLE